MAIYGIKDASDVIIVEKGTSNVVAKANYANKTDIEFKADRVWAKKKGNNQIPWDANRQGTLTFESEEIDLKFLALMASGKGLTKGANTIFKDERFKLTEDKLIRLSETPLPGTVSVHKLNADGLTHDLTIPELVVGEGVKLPTMPTNVSVSAKDTSAEITWTAVDTALSYIVYRDGAQIGQPVTTSFTDSNLTPEKKYVYTVVAVNGNGNSPASAKVEVTTATAGTGTAGNAVTATEEAIQEAEKNAKVVSENGLYFKVQDGGTLKLSDNALVGAEYVVYYMAELQNVSSFSVAADKFAPNYEIYANSIIRSESGEDRFAQIYLPNAKPEGNFTIGQDATKAATFQIKFDIMPDENGNMADLKYIEE